MAFSPQRLLQHLKTLLAQVVSPASETKTLWLAYSGGLDSHVLLHALASLKSELKNWQIRAVHVDHGLHVLSADWGQHCQAICKQLSIPCQVIKVNIKQDGESLEAVARDARYQAFADCLQKGDVLLTAQHADDQAETFMLQMLRGSGPRGLSAMPASRVFASGSLLRPLLGFRRQQLQTYAEQYGLEFIHDPSNDDKRFDRNFLRHDVFPGLAARWPSVVQTLCRNAQHQAEAAELLDVLAEQDMLSCTENPGCLSLSRLEMLDDNRQRNLLRYWLRQQGVTVPHRRKLNEILRAMLSAAEDRQPRIDWPGGEVRRYRGEMYASDEALLPQSWEQTWDLLTPLMLPAGLGSLAVTGDSGQALDLSRITSAPISVRFRGGGENCLPAGRGHHHSLKKLFQESAIPPWQRQRTPLVYVGNELAQIMGVCICEPFKAREGRPAVNIEWQQQHSNC